MPLVEPGIETLFLHAFKRYTILPPGPIVAQLNPFPKRQNLVHQAMLGIEDPSARRDRGCLDGHFLVAMPGMND